MKELQKVDKLSDFKFLAQNIILPALKLAKERQWITTTEELMLHVALANGVAKASDFKEVTKELTEAQRTYQIKKMVERKLLIPIEQGARQYTIGFRNNYLMRGVVQALINEGFVPASLNNQK